MQLKVSVKNRIRKISFNGNLWLTRMSLKHYANLNHECVYTEYVQQIQVFDVIDMWMRGSQGGCDCGFF